MITLIRPAYYENERRAEYKGISADDKSTIKAKNGDKFYEIDTSKWFIYDEDISAWVEMGISQTVGSFNLPKISPATTGLFLTNDGTFAHWHELSLSDFIITLTDNKDGTYIADKSYLEIKASLEAKENIAVSIGNSRLPLMSAEIADNGDAGFTFGYTQVYTDGQLISTRAVNYHHTADPVGDEWTDADQSADLSTIKIETASKASVSLYANSGVTVGLDDGVYLFSTCDERHRGLSAVFVCGTTSTVFGLTGMAGWSVEKNDAKANAIYINNTLDVPMTVYITAIGAGSVGKFE